MHIDSNVCDRCSKSFVKCVDDKEKKIRGVNFENGTVNTLLGFITNHYNVFRSGEYPIKHGVDLGDLCEDCLKVAITFIKGFISYKIVRDDKCNESNIYDIHCDGDD